MVGPVVAAAAVALAVGTLHILLDFGVGLFPLQGRLSPAVGATLLLVSLIHAWWSVSLAAGAHGNGGGVASAAILGLGWTLLIFGRERTGISFSPQYYYKCMRDILLNVLIRWPFVLGILLL